MDISFQTGDPKKKKKISKRFWILFLIIVLGVFLRTYHFRDWLDFESDQARDTLLVQKELSRGISWPLLGPDMSHSNNPEGLRFHIGPMYYYFQIISGKIFGVRPETMAYPDLFFSILAIPLFYFFLKKYFSANLSLALTGLFSVSFYLIQYSRFAYNPNPTPFFVILFLFSLSKMMDKREKVSWWWIVSAGIALGVGIQLHVIPLVLFPATAFFVFLYLLWKNWRIWKKLVVLIFLILLLNAGQIRSELRTNFANSKIFLSSIFSSNKNQSVASHYINNQYAINYGDDQTAPKRFFVNLAMNADCHIQANWHMLSSQGDQFSCDFSYVHLFNYQWTPSSLYHVGDYTDCADAYLKKTGVPTLSFIMIIGVLFSIFGYGALIEYFKREKNIEKKHFLGIILLYSLLSFIVMMPVIGDAPIRYFINIFFLPYIFLGLLIVFLSQKFSRKYWWAAVLIFLFLAVTNAISIKGVVDDIRVGDRSGPNTCGPDVVVLKEIEPMADYIINQSLPQNEAYIIGSSRYMFFNPLRFVAHEKNFTFSLVKGMWEVPAGKSFFYIQDCPSCDFELNIFGYKIDSRKDFGQVSIYKLENQPVYQEK